MLKVYYLGYFFHVESGASFVAMMDNCDTYALGGNALRRLIACTIFSGHNSHADVLIIVCKTEGMEDTVIFRQCQSR